MKGNERVLRCVTHLVGNGEKIVLSAFSEERAVSAEVASHGP